MKPFELCDGVVRLRSPGPDDIDAIYAICQDPDVREWTTVSTPYTREQAAAYVNDFVLGGWEQGTSQTWALRDIADAERVVGAIGLSAQPIRSADVGYSLAREARGRGLMSRAMDLVLHAAFGPLGLERVEWWAYVGNTASRAVAERTGFRIEGCIRGGAIKADTRRDTWVGTVLRDDVVGTGRSPALSSSSEDAADTAGGWRSQA